MPIVGTIVVAAALLPRSAHAAEVRWTRAPDPSSPPALSGRSSAALVHHPRRGSFFLFGGTTVPSTPVPNPMLVDETPRDTWECIPPDRPCVRVDAPSDRPLPCGSPTLLYDIWEDSLLVYGLGCRSERGTQTLWRWQDGATSWSEVDKSATGAIAVRALLDPGARRLLEFSRQAATAPRGPDVRQWDLDSRRWSGPLARAEDGPLLGPQSDLQVVLDSGRGRAIVVAGCVPGSSGMQIWEFQQSSTQPWRRRPSGEGAPAGRVGFAVAYDDRRDQVILLGGENCDRTPLADPRLDTWQWSPEEDRWQRLESTTERPPGRSRPAVAFDRARGRLVLFGGDASAREDSSLSDLWVMAIERAGRGEPCGSDGQCATGLGCRFGLCCDSADCRGEWGAACQTGRACRSGLCQLGSCCPGACAGPCETCGTDGVCRRLAADERAIRPRAADCRPDAGAPDVAPPAPPAKRPRAAHYGGPACAVAAGRLEAASAVVAVPIAIVVALWALLVGRRRE